MCRFVAAAGAFFFFVAACALTTAGQRGLFFFPLRKRFAVGMGDFVLRLSFSSFSAAGFSIIYQSQSPPFFFFSLSVGCTNGTVDSFFSTPCCHAAKAIRSFLSFFSAAKGWWAANLLPPSGPLLNDSSGWRPFFLPPFAIKISD